MCCLQLKNTSSVEVVVIKRVRIKLRVSCVKMQPWTLILGEPKNEDSPHSAEGSSATDSGRGASDEGGDNRPLRYIPPPPPPASVPRASHWAVQHHPHQQPPPYSSCPSSSSSSSHSLPSRSLLRSARKQTGPGAAGGHHLYPTSTRGTVRFKGLNTTPEEDADEVEMTASAPSTSTMTLPSVRSSTTAAALVCDGLPRNGTCGGARGSCGPPPPPVRQRVDPVAAAAAAATATSTPSRIVLPDSLSSSSTTSRSPCIFVTTSRSFDV